MKCRSRKSNILTARLTAGTLELLQRKNQILQIEATDQRDAFGYTIYLIEAIPRRQNLALNGRKVKS